VTEDWPEPSVPQDLATALAAAPKQIQDLWNEITPMARWEWVRWVNSTKNPDTRGRRVDVSISKMKSGKRRPCCFNLSACTDPDMSKNGRLLDQEEDRPRSTSRRAGSRGENVAVTTTRGVGYLLKDRITDLDVLARGDPNGSHEAVGHGPAGRRGPCRRHRVSRSTTSGPAIGD